MYNTITNLSPRQRDALLTQLLAEQGLDLARVQLSPRSPAGLSIFNDATQMMLHDLNQGDLSDAVAKASGSLEGQLDDFFEPLKVELYADVADDIAGDLFTQIEHTLQRFSDHLVRRGDIEMDAYFLDKVSNDVKELIVSDAFSAMRADVAAQLLQHLLDSLTWNIDENRLNDAVSSAVENVIKENLLVEIANNVCVAEVELLPSTLRSTDCSQKVFPN